MEALMGAKEQEDFQRRLGAAKRRIRDYASSVRRFPHLHSECPPTFLSTVERLDTLPPDEVFDLAQHVENVCDPQP
jgi:hypothetical protein